MFHDHSNDILCRCVIGRKYGEDGDMISANLVGKLTTKSLPISFAKFFSSLGWLDIVTSFIGRLKKTAREFDLFLDRVIEEHITWRTKDDNLDEEKDFVDLLLQIQEEEDHLTRDNIKALILDIFFAGVDTSVTVQEWAMDLGLRSCAKEFIPERFMSTGFDLKCQDFEFIPFGVGRRMCLGISFGSALVELTLANLLYWFDWEMPVGKEGLDMTEAIGVACARKFRQLVTVPHFNHI
ncbi:hypothetical protein Sjap_016294 [Stephania japonica]|uniref:Cytochrome P450 n=1 Tax=Stephania japonica TaxID=461633 RepID=A0AAP0IMR1_9MAGN